ncbi:MAG: hypothetical protein NT124_00520 [Candidatus Dependentiae bacterium]|nr:hypothetical protein [Candidatus Dependentiae bacterium]
MLEKKHLLLLLSVLLFMNKNKCLDSVDIQIDDQLVTKNVYNQLVTEQETYQKIGYRKPKNKQDNQNGFNATDPGQLDRTFGTEGRVISTNFEGVLTGIAIRQTTAGDYEIVTTGASTDRTPLNAMLLLTTYNRDGNQIAKVDFSSTTPPAFGTAIAIDSENRIVIGGNVGINVNLGRQLRFMARRYINPTTLDTSFNPPTGTAYASLPTIDILSLALAIDTQNRILLAGGVFTDNGNFQLVKFTNSGQLDSSFGGPNATNPGFSSGGFPLPNKNTIKGIALQENGAIIVSGQSGERFVLARYSANGVFDTTWPTGPNGGIVTDFTPLGLVNRGARSNAVALQKDGKIVAVGTTATNVTGTGQAFVLARYNPNGTLDTTFGSGGLQVAPFNSAISEATAVAIDANGFIIVAGLTTPTGTSQECFALAVFNPDGSLNNEFGNNGLVVTAFGNNGAGASSVAIEPISKKIIVGGNTNQHFALACYNGIVEKQAPLPVARFSSNGTLDPRFGK